MSKTAISQYSATPSSNSDVDGIDISEGCPASNLNNAQRSLMSHLKEMDDGTSALTSPSMGQLNVDNLRLDGNTISSTDTNGDITIDPDGTGDTIITSGKLGIGTQSPSDNLSVVTSGSNAQLSVDRSDGGAGRTVLIHSSTGGQLQTTGSVPLLFGTADTERMRVDTSGVVTVGKTDAGSDVVGATIRGTGQSSFTMDGNSPLILNRKSNTGDIALLQNDNTTAGSVGVANTSEVYFTASGGNGTGLYMSNGATVVPMKGGSVSDNTVDCGHASYRFDNIRATNGTIQTSDQNEKQDIASLTSAEITAAKAISALFKTFKWKDKVEAKGDDARTHTGVIAQEVQTAMTNAGLDAADYAFWCSDTWTDDDGNSQTRMGIRYPELLAFVGAATEQRLSNIESRLTALEAE